MRSTDMKREYRVVWQYSLSAQYCVSSTFGERKQAESYLRTVESKHKLNLRIQTREVSEWEDVKDEA